MSGQRRNVLVVGVSSEQFARVAPFLSREDFVVDRFPSPGGALDLITVIPFELLVVGCPLATMHVSDFVERIRTPPSLCATASVVLLETAEHTPELESLIGRGANRLVALSASGQEIQSVVSEVVGVAPRKEARILSRFEVKFGGAKDLILCQTENLSTSGMLIRTERRYETGIQSDFELTPPNDPRPITGTVEIVRQTMIGRDSIGGIGVRFVAFDGDSERRYRRLLETF